jgi:hypothetical protein
MSFQEVSAMKYLASATTQTVRAATFRDLIDVAGLHRRCRIRKCRRDGHCTGPLYTPCPTTPDLCLVDPEDIEAQRYAVLPVCAIDLSEHEIPVISDQLDKRMAQVKRQPGLTLLSPERAIAARRWSSFTGIVPMPASEQPPLTPPGRAAAGSSETA